MTAQPRGFRNGARLAALALLCLPAGLPADELGELLLDDHGCYTCHAYEQRGIGPSLAAIAKRYADQPEMAGELARRTIAGTVGAWGDEPMRPHLGLPEDEALLMVFFVLSLATDP
jgi:cytochrome c551/c552